ncbi:ABC transporter substrate-binding protein [Roseomonas haemaphysalidis]|uniref:ABC transporter substrate-binding protein n=1 Tax=Roseomonas haemaphysalidis TaxID=2768162 RepID=A0ABS3KR10_9PROT|nr:ABC transporter substrate-binding protein [Roseomonas haemaphysalidis]MBO1079879.1 ABC transporter substrate-binding protein [Roseomonas haemaphysalidis]
MQRRSLLKAAAAAPLLSGLAMPAVGQNSRASTLRFVPQANLAALDPIWTTATVTGNHGYYVFDTLYALNAAGQPRPQMAEGHEVLEDGKLWRIRLRPGLRFHDDTPVRAEDCVASLKRWAVRDAFGQLLAAVARDWTVVDDRTFEIRLDRAFPLVSTALAKSDGSAPFIMPARLAATDPGKAVTEMVGSGPYRFLADQFNSGSRAVYEKFAGYVPRDEPPDYASGGKVAHFQRIEWQIITDPSTAAAALVNGEIDWWERPLADLQPILARSRDITRAVTDKAGRTALARLNCLQEPFKDVRIRRAALAAVVQEDYMRAAQGDDTSLWSTVPSIWPKNTPYYADNSDLMPGDVGRARAMLKEAGYGNQKVVIINPTDFPDIGPLGQVTADALKRAGMNVELAESDWGTVIQRRASKEATDKGGWSVFHTTGPAGFYGSPAMSPLIRGQGEAGWFGWWKSDRAEALTQEWLYAPDEAGQKKAAMELGRLGMEEVATVPLGQFTLRTAFRRDITGIVDGTAPYPWGVRRA